MDANDIPMKQCNNSCRECQHWYRNLKTRELIPYGCAKLRMTEMPILKMKK